MPISLRWWAASREASARSSSFKMTQETATAPRLSRRRSLLRRAARLPTHIDLPVDQSCGLSRNSIILLEQVRTLDKKRLRERMGHVEEAVMEKVDTAIAVSFGLPHDQLV